MNLPTEIMLVILSFFKGEDLYHACLLNKTFNKFASRRLYQRIELRKAARLPVIRTPQVIQLLKTLAVCPHLAHFVQHLSISSFNKSMSSESFVLDAIRNCRNLQSCSWSELSSEILQELSSCSNLRELEVDGENWCYGPDSLLRFKNLEKLSVVKPSVPVLKQMHDCLALNSASIRSLTFTCNHTMFTDDYFAPLAKLLPNLEDLHLAGCHQLTTHDLWHFLLSNNEGLVRLDLDGLSSLFDVEALCLACESQTSHPLRRLRRIAFKFVVPLLSAPAIIFSATRLPPTVDPKRLLPAIYTLSSHSTLEMFQLHIASSSCGSKRCNFLASEPNLWHCIVDRHAKTLRQFSLWGISTSSDLVKVICRECINLEELRVVVLQEPIETLCGALSPSKSLRSIQIDFHLLSQPTTRFTSSAHDQRLPQYLSPSDIISILKHCSFTVTRFGSALKMWEVKRTVVCSFGVKEIQLSLEPLKLEFEN